MFGRRAGLSKLFNGSRRCGSSSDESCVALKASSRSGISIGLGALETARDAASRAARACRCDLIPYIQHGTGDGVMP
jgi:hypothetical protein